MTIEFVKKHIFRSEHPAPIHLYGEVKPVKPIRLSPDVERLLNRASQAQADGNEEGNRHFSIQAASMAMVIYEAPAVIVTTEDRLFKSAHGLLAFSQFLELGESESASAIGAAILKDQSIPEVSRDKVRRDLEALGRIEKADADERTPSDDQS